MPQKHQNQNNHHGSAYFQSPTDTSQHQNHLILFKLKGLWFRKSFFCPPPGLDQSYASRNHMAGVDFPIVEVVHSSHRWLLLQTPKFSRNFFKKLNSGNLGNPYEQLMRVFKGFIVLTQIFGYFRPTNDMVMLQKREIRVWVNEDIFSNQPQMPLKKGKDGEREFVVAFLAMVQSQMNDWERAINVCAIDETLQMLEWRSRLTRNSYSALNASKQVIRISSDGDNSINNSELISYQTLVKGGKYAYQINRRCPSDYLKVELSSSITWQEEEKRVVPKKIKKLLTDSKGDMKCSIYNEIKVMEPSQEARKGRKKFALNSTSSTLQKFSDKLGTTNGKRIKLLQKPENKEKQKLANSGEQGSLERKKGGMHKSEPISIANELEGLFEREEAPELKLGIEGDRDQLEKIAEQIEQVLIW